MFLWAALGLWVPALAFDHSFATDDSVLTHYVSDGRVDYAGLRAHRADLDRFLADGAAVSFDEYQAFLPEQKLAFMINLYNAAVLALVCDHPALKSVDEFKGIFHDVWSIKFIQLFDHTVSLGQILHDILRSEFKDTRVHFALVTACKSDPELLNEPYRAEILRQQLDRQIDKFMLERPAANRYENNILYLSPKFKWFAVDFGKRANLLRYVKNFFPQVNDHTPIRYTSFDWSLNAKENAK